MGELITSLPGITDKGMAAVTFRRAGLPTLHGIRTDDSCERRLDGALLALQQEPEYAHWPTAFWSGLRTRCTTILFHVRGPHGDPFPPDAFCCSISHSWLCDAVVTPQGVSFSRGAIEEWLTQSPTCPLGRMALSRSGLIPNHQLQKAVDFYRCEHQRLFAALRA